MTKASPSVPPAPNAGLTHSRYQLHEQLGRGGMANVYRALDRVTGRIVALKLLSTRSDRERTVLTTLFEREYHTLVQLKHPHVIEVYDYGVFGDGTPFYTMELLDGGDVRARAPIPWREACSLFFEVCSSLALLHSRRLLHRDISPLNVRCTSNGHAKLIDFGAMSAMSAGGADVVGTPAFVGPETLHRLTLDARTDLYSLGATLYYALTGTLAYPARTFAEVMEAWSGKVRAPSSLVADIPAALDDLVLSLISVEPALRPPSAFDVMQLLAAIAELQPQESEAVPRAYLSTPALIGREGAVAEFRHNLLTSRLSRGRALLLAGPPGVGRSRMLDACSLEAKTLGFSVLRASATGAQQPFATIQSLAMQALEALPDESQPAPLFDPEAQDGEGVQREATRFFLNKSAHKPLLFAVDDVHLIDPRSAAVLAGLLDKAARGRVFVIISADRDAPESVGLSVLARRCSTLAVEPLTKKQTRALFSSVFGDVANLDLVAQEVYAVSGGVPRVCMDIAQHLVDRGLIRYASGTWTLPSKLATSDLPQSAAEAANARIALLSDRARFLAQALALAFSERLSDPQCRLLLPDVERADVDAALSELVASAVVLRQGSEYALPNRLWTDALTRALSPDEARDRQRALAELYRSRNRVAFIYHAFAGDLEADGLDALAALNAGYAQKLDLAQIYEDNVPKMMVCYPRALESAARLGKSPRFINDLLRWRFAGALLEEARLPDSAGLWRAQLCRDAGLDLYQSDPDTSDAMQRLFRALQGAQARYLATPEAERVYSVEEAIKLLAEYVVLAIGHSARSHDSTFLRSLPALLEPFAPLSPMLDAIWNNALATVLGHDGHYARARERWLEVIEKLDALKSSDIPFADAIANAVAFGIGLMEAQLGMPSATSWAERLDRDPTQRVAALQLRRVVRMQQGDARGADRFRRQAELVSLSSRMPQLFKSLLAVELTACANARDLAGIQDVVERMRPVAARFEHWLPNLLYAEASFHQARGDYPAAKAKCEECIALTLPDAQGTSRNLLMWTAAHVCLAEVLLATNQAAEARAVALRLSAAPADHQAHSLRPEAERVLALVEARLGDAAAVPRIEALIASQRELGVSGLRLGISYEARCQIAIWQRDESALEEYAALTAHEYRYGADSALGARYDRMINEARRQGLQTTATLEHFATDAQESSLFTNEVRSSVKRSLAPEQTTNGRLLAALQLVCAARQVSEGQLYMRGAEGVQLAASIGNAPALTELAPLDSFLDSAEERARRLDEMSTDELISSPSGTKTTVKAGDLELELLALSTIIDADHHFIGVVAVPVPQSAVHEPHERQLLSSIAAQLIPDRKKTLAPKR